MNQKRSRLISLVIALVIVAGGWSAWGVEKAEAIIIICKTPMFGITRGETARAYVVNIGDANGLTAIIRFLDGAGNVLAESGEIRLPLEQGGFFDLSADNLVFGSAQRFPIRVEITIEDPSVKKFRKTVDITSVEVSDNVTGKVNFVLQAPPEPE